MYSGTGAGRPCCDELTYVHLGFSPRSLTLTSRVQGKNQQLRSPFFALTRGTSLHSLGREVFLSDERQYDTRGAKFSSESLGGARAPALAYGACVTSCEWCSVTPVCQEADAR